MRNSKELPMWWTKLSLSKRQHIVSGLVLNALRLEEEKLFLFSLPQAIAADVLEELREVGGHLL